MNGRLDWDGKLLKKGDFPHLGDETAPGSRVCCICGARFDEKPCDSSKIVGMELHRIGGGGEPIPGAEHLDFGIPTHIVVEVPDGRPKR